jgi:cytidine deaminase
MELPRDYPTHSELLAQARHAAAYAYAPYSGFAVGAAVLAADGSIFAGCNVENASLGLTICAERAAVCATVTGGHREIVAIAVSAPQAPLTLPCGACRQVLHEFRPRDWDMVVVLDDGAAGELVTLTQLLPRAFGPGQLDPQDASDEEAIIPGPEDAL